MYLNKAMADRIIKEIRNVIDFNINIINNNGFIISSTDPERVNNYHEAAQLVIRNNYKELIVEYDGQFEGCMSGVNLPIYFSNEVIGIVGITGKPEEVVQYARIIQKMTEMIMDEYFDLWNRNNQEQVKLVFTNDLIHGNFYSSLFRVEDRLQQYKLNIKGSFTVSLIKFVQSKNQKNNSEEYNSARNNIVKQYIYDKISYRKTLAAYNGEFFILVTNLSVNELTNEIEYLSKKIKQLHGVSLLCSIGNMYDSYEKIPKSYVEALSIYEYLEDESGVYQFNQLSLNITISKIPENYKLTLKNQIFEKCDRKEMEEFIEFIKGYIMCDGSLNQLADKFYIHKNTVQYKIQKIKRKTGYDLRVYKDMLTLYLVSIV